MHQPVSRRPIAVLAAAALWITTGAVVTTSAQAATVEDSPILATPGAPEPGSEQTLVESIDLAGLDPEGMDQPDVDAPAVHVDPQAEHDHAPEDIALEGDVAADSAEAVVVGLSRRLDLAAGQVTTLGVTWTGSHPDVNVDVRTLVGGEWGDWSPLEVDTSTSPEGGRGGTGPFVVTEAQEVQVRVLTADGRQPADLRLFAVGVGSAPEPVVDDGSAIITTSGPGDTSVATVSNAVFTVPQADAHDEAGTETTAPEDDLVVDQVSAAAQMPLRTAKSPVTAPQPAIHLRSEWGAAPFVGTPEVTDVQAAVVHHTVSSNTYTAAQVPAMLRSIQAYHVNGRGWSDIGYNFLVDRFGRIWEGRQGGITKEIRGVHASEANSVSTGISVIGNHDVAGVPAAVRTAVSRLIAWKLALHGVVVGATFELGGKVFPNIIGHRDVPTAQTACPGRYLYPLLPSIRSQAAAFQTFVPVDYSRSISGPGSQDLLATGSTTQVVPIAPAPVTSARKIGWGWSGMDLVVSSPAFRGGPTTDLLARERATGRLYVYHGNGRGGFAGRTQVGQGWGMMSQIIGAGDFDGDGIRDIIGVQRSNGLLWLYPGNGRLGFGPGKRIGNGWGHIIAMAGGHDLTGDGHPDLAGVLRDGTVKIYPGNGRGGFLSAITTGAGHPNADALALPGDVTHDGFPDIVIRDGGTGEMVTLAGNGRGRTLATSSWGRGWNVMPQIMSGYGWTSRTGAGILAIGHDGVMNRYDAKRNITLAAGIQSSVDTAAAKLVAIAGQVTGSARADVVTVDSAGVMYLHETGPDGVVGAGRQIGSGWNHFEQIVPLGDLDYDGAPDLLARHRDGRLLVYPFEPGGDGAFGDSYSIGHGFQGYTLVPAPGWEPGAGVTVLAINDRTGALRRFVPRGKATMIGGQTIGVGWGGFSDVVAIDNAAGNGRTGLLARYPNGTMRMYIGNGRGGFDKQLSVSGSIPRDAGVR